MEQEIMDKYLKAGKIAAQVREQCKTRVKVGTMLVDIAEWAENRIKELGAELVFPVNISINNIAAHFTPIKDDKGVFKEDDVVKIDIGAHIDGYIGDTAVTISLGAYEDLLKASEDALNEAIKIIKPGIKVSEIGNIIEQVIKKYGFKPITNLTGHGLDNYDLHAEPQIPNTKTDSDYELKENQVIAIEPFATTGSGFVKESEEVMIFSLTGSQPVRNPDARKILQLGLERRGLPFTKRWLPFTDIKFRLALKELEIKEILHKYPVLFDIEGCKISQFEHTVIVRDEPIVTTI